MKNFTRNKFMLCFRPVVETDSLVLDSEGSSKTSTQSLKYVSSRNRPSISDNECCRSSEISMMVRHPSKRTFCHAIKAVLFETILAKRVRDRRSLSRDSYPSKRRFCRGRSLDSGHDDKSVKRVSSVDHTGIREIKSSSDVLSSQSSVRSSSSFCLTSSISESKRHNQERIVQQPTEKSSSLSFNCCISLLLMILAATILWGKFCAILFTSIWLYFIPQQRTCRPENLKSLSKKESTIYKKRIIMEGILERDHRRESALNF